MVKHTQTIRRQQPPSVFGHFVGLALKGLILADLATHQMNQNIRKPVILWVRQALLYHNKETPYNANIQHASP